MTQTQGSDDHHPSKLIHQDPVRSSVRFPIRISLKIEGTSGSFEAFTENISANGILFSSTHLPELNSQIEFTMAMPAAVMGSEQDVAVHCIGRIVRHEPDGTEKKAAVVIDEYFLRA